MPSPSAQQSFEGRRPPSRPNEAGYEFSDAWQLILATGCRWWSLFVRHQRASLRWLTAPDVWFLSGRPSIVV